MFFEENDNFELLEGLHAVDDTDIENLLKKFKAKCYDASYADETDTKILEKCIQLMRRDYSISTINNNKGVLCDTYPAKIIIFNTKKEDDNATTINEADNSLATLFRMLWDARFARCRTRFPIPAINYKGKNICRSSTLSGGPEIFTRTGMSYMFGSSAFEAELPPPPPRDITDEELNPNRKWLEIEDIIYERVRLYDISLLNRFQVGTIVDLMVENKKVKFGMYVSSSEKCYGGVQYGTFKTVGAPYPGCEFFKDFSANNYTAENLVYDWAQDFNDAPINIPNDYMSRVLNINWQDYREWDLIQITQNYLKLMLRYIQESKNGILIHCISGWDRTPLFISLIRISMWADGLIHKSLDAYQLLYLTLAYDWYLFGHQLSNRVAKGENIMLFCFHFLKFITGDEYSLAVPSSVNPRSKKQESGASTGANDFESSILLDNESRGSNVSINSACSSVSTKSQDHLGNVLNLSEDSSNGFSKTEDSTNGNASYPPQGTSTESSNLSPHNKRTSPVAMPNSRLRQRHDSTTSTGSWQFITTAGSLRSNPDRISTSERANRINQVRDAFYLTFPKIGIKMKTVFYTGILGKVASFASQFIRTS